MCLLLVQWFFQQNWTATTTCTWNNTETRFYETKPQKRILTWGYSLTGSRTLVSTLIGLFMCRSIIFLDPVWILSISGLDIKNHDCKVNQTKWSIDYIANSLRNMTLWNKFYLLALQNATHLVTHKALMSLILFDAGMSYPRLSKCKYPIQLTFNLRLFLIQIIHKNNHLPTICWTLCLKGGYFMQLN